MLIVILMVAHVVLAEDEDTVAEALVQHATIVTLVRLVPAPRKSPPV